MLAGIYLRSLGEESEDACVDIGDFVDVDAITALVFVE